MSDIWQTWSANGDDSSSVAIITTDANQVVGDLHNRMSVILDLDEEDTWLDSGDE